MGGVVNSPTTATSSIGVSLFLALVIMTSGWAFYPAYLPDTAWGMLAFAPLFTLAAIGLGVILSTLRRAVRFTDPSGTDRTPAPLSAIFATLYSVALLALQAMILIKVIAPLNEWVETQSWIIRLGA